MADAPRPSGLIATKGLELLTFNTPNGVKASLLLEELKAAYGLDYTVQAINITQNVQKDPWYTKLGPNGRIPVLVDHDKGGFAVQETMAILLYLARHYDSEHKFTFTDPLELSRMEQWMAWQQGGLGPMQGQANHFDRFAKEHVPYGMQRYTGETERLLGVLDAQLRATGDYLVGGKYSLADMMSWGWINVVAWVGIDLRAQFPHVDAWYQRIKARPATQTGANVPAPSPFTNDAHARRLATEPDFAASERDFAARLQAAKDQYGYKYASP